MGSARRENSRLSTPETGSLQRVAESGFQTRKGGSVACDIIRHTRETDAVSTLVGAFADGTPWPLGWVVALAGVGGVACAWFLVPQPEFCIRETL